MKYQQPNKLKMGSPLRGVRFFAAATQLPKFQAIQSNLSKFLGHDLLFQNSPLASAKCLQIQEDTRPTLGCPFVETMEETFFCEDLLVGKQVNRYYWGFVDWGLEPFVFSTGHLRANPPQKKSFPKRHANPPQLS